MSQSAGTAGEIIYKALMPTVKMALCIGGGFTIAKAGALSSASTKGMSLVVMNLALPCLIFSSMVAAFDNDNATAFGPLILVAVVYEALGLLCGIVVREIMYVPKDFRWGILVMGVCSNWGNLPTAVVQTMAKESPFNPATDVDLGVAYIAIFVLVMNSTFFALGVHKMTAWDFVEDLMLDDPAPFRQRWKARLVRMRGVPQQLSHCLGRSKRPHDVKERASPEAEETSTSSVTELDDVDTQLPTRTRSRTGRGLYQSGTSTRFVDGTAPTRLKSRTSSFTARMESTPRIAATTPLEGAGPSEEKEDDDPTSEKPPTPTRTPDSPCDQPYTHVESSSTPSLGNPRRTLRDKVVSVLKNTPPPTWSVIIGLPCALVRPLKALLTPVPGWTGSKMPNAPDGNPPLYFILETTEFVGELAVPLALLLLGASFARLKVPSRWRDIPAMAIVSMTLGKMVLVPVISVFIVLALQRNTGMFPPADKIRTFVAILLSGTPASVNQLVITQLYNPAGTAHTLASFLLLQYAAMFVLSTALAAIALYVVEQ